MARTSRTTARRGPRPLPLHLATSWFVSTSSLAALPLARSGSLPWNPSLAEAASALARDLARVHPERLAKSVADEAERRLSALIDGVTLYQHHPYARRMAEPAALWREGTTRLLDYRPKGGRPVLFVPSLINRAYVLDLAPGRSLLRALAERGLRPLLLDWDAPGEAERGFTLTDYVAGRLEAALDATLGLSKARPIVVGYCMGGLLALALALRRKRDVAGLALLATPWDFSEGAPPFARLFATEAARAALRWIGVLPVDVIQGLLAAVDPRQVPAKMRAFAALDPASDAARAFVALEDWLNDGVPLAGPVAEECLGDWYGENAPARERWRVAGEVVRPEAWRGPTLVVVPARDRIVPPASAEALAARIKQARVLRPPAGHIGMMVGRQAEALLWRPLGDWIVSRGA
jgi:polyhydroxyalkanoate synthase